MHSQRRHEEQRMQNHNKKMNFLWAVRVQWPKIMHMQVGYGNLKNTPFRRQFFFHSLRGRVNKKSRHFKTRRWRNKYYLKKKTSYMHLYCIVLMMGWIRMHWRHVYSKGKEKNARKMQICFYIIAIILYNTRVQ